MSTLTNHPAYAQVEDLLDSVGQRYRVFLLLRGGILFLAFTIALVIPAAFLASFFGPGLLTRSIAIATLLALAAALLYWIGRPLIFRPRSLAIARMIEQRIPGTHNGLTNLVLLAHADDLSANPWMDEIFREIASGVSQRPLASAVRFADLRKPALIAWGIALPILALGLLFSGQLVHGASQIARPGDFVPMQGAVELLEVHPGNATVIKGRPFELTAIAKGTGEFPAQVIFEDQPQPLPMAGSNDPDGRRRFTFIRDHVDESTRYRINAGGTESAWYNITAIRQVSLQSLTVAITPPAYTRAQAQTLRLAPAELAKQSIAAPQGSMVNLAFDIDVPVSSGMLQAGDSAADTAPIPAAIQMDGKRFAAEIALRESMPLSMLLTDGAGQIIARLPEQPLLIQATPDQAPGIDLKWPQSDTAIAPTRELRIEARLRDDYGLTNARLLWSPSPDEPMQVATEKTFADRPTNSEFSKRSGHPRRRRRSRQVDLGADRSHRQPRPALARFRIRPADHHQPPD